MIQTTLPDRSGTAQQPRSDSDTPVESMDGELHGELVLTFEREWERVERAFSRVNGTVVITERQYGYDFIENEEVLMFDWTHAFELADDNETVVYAGQHWTDWAEDWHERSLSNLGWV